MRGSRRGGCGGSDGERDGRAGRAGLRRHHGRAGGRGAGGAAARVPAVGALLGRGHARAGRRRAAHVRAGPARLLAGRPPGRPGRLPDGRGGRRRGGGRRGRSRADRAVARARRRARLGRRSSPGRSPGARPELVHTVTGISAPPPGAVAARCAGPARSLASWYMAAFAVPGPGRAGVRRARAERRGHRRWSACSSTSGQTRERAERDAARLADPAALTAALNWYRAIPLRQACRPDGATGRRCSSGATATPP